MSADALAVDDTAFSYLPRRPVLKIGVVSPGNVALERALRLLPRVEVVSMPPSRYRERADVDVWVFDRYAPRRAPALPSLLFRPPPVQWLPASVGTRPEAAASTWLRNHPLTEGLSLRDVVVRHVQTPRADARFEIIAADAKGGPLIVATTQGIRQVDTLFALDDSNLSLQSGFPVFLANVLDWLSGEPRPVQVGIGRVTLPLPAAKVLDLQGQPVPSRSVIGGTLLDVQHPGFFVALAAEGHIPIAANVADPSITRINDSSLAEWSPAAVRPAPAGILRGETWLPLLAIAALLMALEWWTFNRRLTV
jgi:hypothetical protein